MFESSPTWLLPGVQAPGKWTHFFDCKVKTDTRSLHSQATAAILEKLWATIDDSGSGWTGCMIQPGRGSARASAGRCIRLVGCQWVSAYSYAGQEADVGSSRGGTISSPECNGMKTK